MAVKKIVCELCGAEISASNYSKHLRRHENHPETFEASKYALSHAGLTCQFCDKEWKSRNSLCNHERQCKANPECQVSGFSIHNRRVQIGEAVTWNKGLTKETDDRVASFAKKLSHPTGRKLSEATKKKLSNSVKLAYAEGRLGTRLHCVKHARNYYGTYKGYECDSSYELAFVIYCLDHNIPITRNLQGFEYTFEGLAHKYFPDFIVNNVYIEIKGRVTLQDEAKWAAFPKDLAFKILKREDMKPYLTYCKDTYGDFINLYDLDRPSWKDRLNNSGA